MSTTHARSLRRAAVVSALALTAAGGAVLASPAGAATTEPLSYSCATSTYDSYTVSVQHTFSEYLVYGGWLTVVSTVTIPASVVSDLNDLGVEHLRGGSAVRLAMSETGGVGTSTYYAAVRGDRYRTPVPATGPLELRTFGDLSTVDYLGGWETGDTIGFALDDSRADDLVLNLRGYDEDGTQVWSSRDCELGDDQDLSLDELTISKAGVKSFVDLRYAAKSGQVVGRMHLSPPESNATPDGQVRFVLKRNGERLEVVTDSLNRRADAVARFDAPRKGRYTLIARYLGSDNFGGAVHRVTERFS